MNSSRMNKLEELGRVDAEKADTKKGKANLSDEKSRIVRELKAKGGRTGTRSGVNKRARNHKRKMKDLLETLKESQTTRPTRPKPKKPRDAKMMNMGGRTNYKSGGAAKRGRGCEIR
jgi:hypothetical protein